MTLETAISRSDPTDADASAAPHDAHGVCSRPIDLVHLARYTMGNKSLEREILDLFVEQSRTVLQRLEAATTEKDWREQAHTLLGSAKAVGAKRLADAVAIAQKLPGGFTSPQRAGALAAVTVELDSANSYIRELFPED